MKLFIITGYSGAGKSVALKAFEDAGFACMDNIPINVMPAVIASVAPQVKYLAICSDVRSPGFDAARFTECLETLRQAYDTQLLFLTCRRDVLIARFNATKHRHPLFNGESVPDSVAREEALLLPLRERADAVIDTSHYTPHALKHHLLELAGVASQGMSVLIQSFSYQHSLPENADLVLDVRFLRNPHYDEALRPMTGLDAPVAAYIAQDAAYNEYLTRLTDLLDWLLPRYRQEGKSYLTIAMGCTGGRHRSVCLTEALAQALRASTPDVRIATRHRELET